MKIFHVWRSVISDFICDVLERFCLLTSYWSYFDGQLKIVKEQRSGVWS